jgi:hypothetical protein
MPVAAGSLACVACLAVAAALPAAAPVADQLTKTVHAGVKLAVDFSALDAFNGIPLYLGLFSGDADTQAESLAGLDSINGLSSFLALANNGGLASFEPNDATGNPGYAALSGLNSVATGNLAGIDAFSALGATGPGDLASVSAIPAFQKFAQTGNTDAFVPDADGNGGYAALSGLSSYRDAASGNVLALGGIDAFSALPVFAGPDGVAGTGGIGALSGYAALSAIPALLGPAPTGGTGDTGGDQLPPAAKVAKPLAASTGADAPAAAGTPAATTTVPKKPGGGSYSAKFSPAGLPVVFGSGGGRNAADNGIRGYGNMLKKIGLGGGDSGGSAKSGAGATKGADGAK